MGSHYPINADPVVVRMDANELEAHTRALINKMNDLTRAGVRMQDDPFQAVALEYNEAVNVWVARDEARKAYKRARQRGIHENQRRAMKEPAD